MIPITVPYSDNLLIGRGLHLKAFVALCTNEIISDNSASKVLLSTTLEKVVIKSKLK